MFILMNVPFIAMYINSYIPFGLNRDALLLNICAVAFKVHDPEQTSNEIGNRIK